MHQCSCVGRSNGSRGDGHGYHSNAGSASYAIDGRKAATRMVRHGGHIVRPRGCIGKLRALGRTRNRAACGKRCKTIGDCCGSDFDAQAQRRASLGWSLAGPGLLPCFQSTPCLPPPVALVEDSREEHTEGWPSMCTPCGCASLA